MYLGQKYNNAEPDKNYGGLDDNLDVRIWIPPIIHYNASLSDFDEHLKNELGQTGSNLAWAGIGLATTIAIFAGVRAIWKIIR